MKKLHVPLIFGLCAVGFFSGYAGHRLFASPSKATTLDANHSAVATNSLEDGNQGPVTISAKPQPRSRVPTLKSTDTLEILTELDDASLYSRLALWMVDASEQEIAAYWQSYHRKDKRDNDINDLIFINWTRLDPSAAIAAATGTPDEHYAWWAWACHDPKAALTAAIAKNADRVNNVAWGIGEFHPEWLRENFDQIPESGRDNALRGLDKWDDHSDPQEVLSFLKEKGLGFNPGLFQTLARRDPWAAYDWIQENGAKQSARYGGTYDLTETFLNAVGESNPEVLQRIAELTPAGELKRKLEARFFESLAKTDPEEAMRQALETKAARIATERIAIVGLGFISTDPEKAFEMAEKLFEKTPDALESSTNIHYPNGSSHSNYGGQDHQPSELVTALLMKDPDRVMAMSLPAKEGSSAQSGFQKIANLWATQDVEGYAHWVNRQTDPAIREPAAGTLINQLQNQEQYGEAAEWALSVTGSSDFQLRNVISRWSQQDPIEARDWLEATDLPEDKKQILRKNLQNQ